MANYLERYQYQPIAAANTNIDQIAKTYQMKLSYFETGAASVKSAYQNALGMDLTLDQNKEALAGYMKTAKQQILDSAQKDLSIGENVSEVLQSFDPISKDKSLLMDAKITQHYREEDARIAAIRKAGDGKYGQTNEALVKLKYQAFANSKRGDEGYHMQNMASYEDYYDVNKEVFDKMKEFDPTTISNDILKDGFIATHKTIEKMPERVRAYLESQLSDKAKRQLEINGAVQFWNDRDVLRSSYDQSLTQKQAQLDSDIEGYNKQYLVAPADKKKEIEEKINGLREQRVGYNDLRERIGNDDWFNKHYETVAGNVSKTQALNGWVAGLADPRGMGTTINSLKMDPVTAFKMKMINDNTQAALDRDAEWQRAVLSSQTSLTVAGMRKGAKGLPDTDASGDVLGSATNMTATEETVAGAVNPAEAAYTESSNTLAQATEEVIKAIPELNDVINDGTKTGTERFELVHAALADHKKTKNQMVTEAAGLVVQEYNNSPEGKKNPVQEYGQVPDRQTRFNQKWSELTLQNGRFQAFKIFEDRYQDHMNLISVGKQAQTAVTNDIMTGIAATPEIRVDRAGFNGEEKMSGKKYVEFLNTLEGLQIKRTVANPVYGSNEEVVPISAAQRQQIATEAQRLILQNPKISDSKALETAYSTIVAPKNILDPSIMKSLQQQKDDEWFHTTREIGTMLTGGELGRGQYTISAADYASKIKGTPFEKEFAQLDKNTYYVNRFGFEKLKDATSGGVTTGEDFKFFIGNKRINADDASQGIYSAFREQASVKYPENNLRAPIRARTITNDNQNFTAWRDAAKIQAGNKAAIGKIMQRPDGSVYYTIVGEPNSVPHKLEDANPERAFNDYDGISALTQKVLKNFDYNSYNGVATKQELSLGSSPLHAVRITSVNRDGTPSFKLERAKTIGVDGRVASWTDMASYNGRINSAAELDQALLDLAKTPTVFTP